jgi:tRNA dimethylallyltransferase
LSTHKKYLIVVQGPTAIGKTAVSISLAQHFNTEIISADSRQFYKEMYIGTARPSPEELAQVKHHCVAHLSIHQDYNAGKYEQEVLTLLESLYRHHDFVVLTGGSGLYVNAVVNGFDDLPQAVPEIRSKWNQIFEEQGIEVLQNSLLEQDPESYKTLAIDNPQRLIRALEVIEISGKKYSSFLNKKRAVRPFTTIKIALTAERPILYQRIENRVDQMVQNGLLNEVKELYPYKHLNALQTVGYQEIFDYLDQKWSWETALSEIKKNTRRYAKRQLTWLRKDPEIIWFDYQTPGSEITSYILQKTR